MNNFALSVALATAPARAFDELRQRPKFWFPLLVLMLSTVAVMIWYYAIVDIEWLKDAILSHNPDLQKLPEDQRAAAMGLYGRKTLMLGSVIGTVIGLPLVFAVSALYLRVAGKAFKLWPGFRHWFAFSCWTSLPLLISSVVAAILLLLADSPQIGMGVLQPLSLNELFFQRPFGAPGQGLLDTLSIPAFLSWALMIAGIRAWSGRSWAFSALFILVPTAAIYGLWAFFALR